MGTGQLVTQKWGNALIVVLLLGADTLSVDPAPHPQGRALVPNSAHPTGFSFTLLARQETLDQKPHLRSDWDSSNSVSH